MLLAYRIGGSTCEISVAVAHGPGRLELLGCAEMAEAAIASPASDLGEARLEHHGVLQRQPRQRQVQRHVKG
jgi:hypothetical protein